MTIYIYIIYIQYNFGSVGSTAVDAEQTSMAKIYIFN